MAESIEALYSEAYALVEQGICFDEVGQRDGALAMYERGLELIDRAGQIPGAEQNALYLKMRDARDHVLYRLKDLRSGTQDAHPAPSMASPPADPFEAIHGTIRAFGDSKSADEIFVIPGGCQIFNIQGEETTVPSYPGELRVFRFKDDSPTQEHSPDPNAPPAFLQLARRRVGLCRHEGGWLKVGDWVYPLIPGRSPVLNTTYGAYIFPNPTAEAPDLYIGLLLPQDLEPGVRGNFEAVLKELTQWHSDSVESGLTAAENERLAAKIGRLLVQGGQAVAWGVRKGQEMTSVFVKGEADKAIQRKAPTDNPRAVDPRVQTSIHYLRRGSKVAVKVSGYLVNKVGKIATAIGSRVAESATKRVGDTSKAGGTLLGDTIEVVKGGVAGVATVYMGMEDAARTLARDIANETCRYVDHRYGEAMGRVTKDGMYAVGHGGMAAWNVTELGPKAIAKRSAKQAGLAVLSDLGAEKGDDPKAIKPARPPPPSS